MDYEKLHKDTINRLQQKVRCGEITVEVACGICADFIPESDDEKIRKELLAVIDDLVLPNAQKERFIAWLEKQGEKGTNGNVMEIPNPA